MVTAEQRQTERPERWGRRVHFGLVERCQTSHGRGRVRTVGSGRGRGVEGNPPLTTPGGGDGITWWGALLQPHEKFPTERLSDGIYRPLMVATV